MRMIKSTRYLCLAGTIAGTLALTACGDSRNATVGSTSPDRSTSSAATTTSTMTSDASTAVNRAADKVDATGDKIAANASDTTTTAKVKTRLMAEPGIDSLQINVDTSNGRVTLTGEVDTDLHRARAKELAGTIEGVTGVVDRMVVKKAS